MRGREVAFLIVGLVVGALAGAVVIGASEPVRTALFGASVAPAEPASEPPPGRTYYLVPFADAAQWLKEAHPEGSEALGEAVDAVAGLSSLPNLTQEFLDAESAVEQTLTGVYVALVGEENAEGKTIVARAPGASDDGLSLCLGMDFSPYATEPTMYLYVTVASDQGVTAPEAWEALESPKDNDIFWMILGCYVPAAEDAA